MRSERGSWRKEELLVTHSLFHNGERGWSHEDGAWSNPRLGCTGCQHSRLLALVRRLTPLHRGGGTHLRKMTKKSQKRYQKDHPAPQKLKFCKIVVFSLFSCLFSFFFFLFFLFSFFPFLSSFLLVFLFSFSFLYFFTYIAIKFQNSLKHI